MAIVTRPEQAVVSGATSPLPPHNPPAAQMILSAPARGTLSGSDIVPAYPAATRAGSSRRLFSPLDDIYNRIYFTPSSFSFGAISSETSAPVVVWNAYLDRSVTLTGVSVPDDIGVTFSGALLPATIRPLAQAQFTLTALIDGAPQFDSTITWMFGDIPWTFDFRVSGLRVKLWPFLPNWGQGSYTITYEYLTEILTSRSGKQQRRANRSTPRKSISFTATVSRSDFLKAKRILSSWQEKTFIMPEVTRYVDSISGMASGSYVLAVQSIPDWATVGATVVLYGAGAMELRVIDDISAETGLVTFTAVTETDFPSGTRMFLGLLGNLSADVQFNRYTNSAASIAVDFSEAPLEGNWIEPPSADVVFNRREVFLLKPNWANPPNVTASHDVDVVDYGYGPIARFTPIRFLRETRQATYVRRSFAEAEKLRQMFDRAKGRRGEFYMPTWESDIEIDRSYSALQASISVPGYEFYDEFVDDTVHRAICIVQRNGDLLFQKVVGLTKAIDEAGDRTVLTLGASLGQEVSPEATLMACWMPVCTFASDELTIEWLTNTVAQSQVTIQTVEDLAPEVAPS